MHAIAMICVRSKASISGLVGGDLFAICQSRDPCCLSMVPKRKARQNATLPLFARAMSTQTVAEDLARVEGRPARVSTGLRGLDERLDGGFPVGELTLIAQRPESGVLDLLSGAVLRAMRRRWPVAWITERREEQEVQARITALAAQVNPARAVAGLSSADDRMEMIVTRKKVPWSRLAILAGRAIAPPEIDELVFSYRPLMVVGELRPRAPEASQPHRLDSYREGLLRLASLARRHHVAMVLLHTLPQSLAAPRVAELPDRGRVAQLASTVVLAHQSDERLLLSVPRLGGTPLEEPRSFRLRGPLFARV